MARKSDRPRERKKAQGRSCERRPAGISKPVDVHVGGRLRLRRTLLGLSQATLAEAVDLDFQQIQKYERGANRIGAAKLFQFSSILGVPVSYFFEEMPMTIATVEAQISKGLQNCQKPLPEAETDPLENREILELVRAYYRIRNPSVRKRLYDLIKTITSANPG